MNAGAPNDPTGHTDALRNLPAEVRQADGWMGTRLRRKQNGRTDKPPYRVRRGMEVMPGSKTNPEHRTSFGEALEALRRQEVDAIGRVFTTEDKFSTIDLDDCRNPETGEIEPWALEIVEAVPSYWEASLSGTGLHGICVAEKRTDRCRKGKVEIYDGATGARFMVMTGNHLEGTPTEARPCQAEMDALTRKIFPPGAPKKEMHRTTANPVDLKDEELLQKAASSKYGAEFRALWSGDTSSTDGDHSRADYRLMKTLLYWTGGDEARAIDLFDRSGLARREKWHRRADYRQRTLRKARMSLNKVYGSDAGPHSSKSEQLKDVVRDLWRRWWAFEWASLHGTGTRPNSMRGHSCRDVTKVLIDAAGKHGTISGAEEVRVSLGRRTIALRAATSLRTVHKAIKHLEAEGWLKFEPPASEEKPGTYVMRASLHHTQNQHTYSGGVEGSGCDKGGGEGLRAPRLMWSRPKYTPRRGVVAGTRKVRESRKPEARDGITRLGKVRGAIIDILDAAGGAATLQEIADALHHNRPRDIRRRNLPMLIDAGIVVVEGETVCLTDDWEERLDTARKIGGEIEAEEVARRRLAIKRNGFHSRYKTQPDDAPTDEDLAAQREAFKAALERQKRRDFEEKRAVALAAFRHQGSGAQKNLELCMSGGFTNIEALTKSVLAWRRPHDKLPFRDWETWRDPVIAAGSEVARERAEAADWRNHDLDCECIRCTGPQTSHARPYRKREGVA